MEDNRTPQDPVDPGVLGQTIRGSIDYLVTIDAPRTCHFVILKTDEFTSVCPVTNQPDWGTVTIGYEPRDLCIESKSLKLYLLRYRNQGHFCEALAEKILLDVVKYVNPIYVRVEVNQKPRGGIGIEAVSTWRDGDDI